MTKLEFNKELRRGHGQKKWKLHIKEFEIILEIIKDRGIYIICMKNYRLSKFFFCRSLDYIQI